jgi:alkylation response protein AidB-like acyl-CoA dehydrogenase
MNFELSDEQLYLCEAAANALSRVDTVAAAREALEDESSLPDLWETAVSAGWSGLLVDEDNGGAGLGPLDAMLIASECGKRLAPVPLLGHLPATVLASGELAAQLASGESRAAWLPAMPPSDLDGGWTVDPASGMKRAAAPTLDGGKVTGAVHWVPDAAGADVLIAIAIEGGQPKAVAIEASAAGVTVAPATVYDSTRPLAHVTLDGAEGTVLEAGADEISFAWSIAQGLIAAESLGSTEEALERAVQYSKERFTFGRPIGSYQAIKHALVEILRLKENARSLMYFAGWAGESAPEQFSLAANAFRVGAGEAIDFGSRELISVHGGIGATWEHDAPLFFRRAQLSRRLVGGTGAAADRVAGELMAEARATNAS